MKNWIEVALQYIGYPSIPYKSRNSGNSPDGFSCSGFVWYVLTQTGFPQSVPSHSNELFDRFGILIHDGLQITGDLVFESKYGLKPNHVEFYIRKGDLTRMLDNSNPGIPKDYLTKFLLPDVNEHLMIGSPGKKNRVVRVREIPHKKIVPSQRFSDRAFIYDRNPIGYKRPAILNGRYHEIVQLPLYSGQ